MKKNIVTEFDADLKLRTLSPEEAEVVRGWIDRLANWEDDAFVREHSPELPDLPGTRVFMTSSEYRIFFSMEGDTITVLDIATRKAILTIGGRL